MKLTIHEMIFQMHLEKQSYDKAVDEIKNVFNLMSIQIQKIQEAMGKIRRNALNYSVKDTVYGMEWLKKNGYSQKKNQRLVRKNPFLPYALILTRQEIEKLGRNDRNVCTSFPVPIVEREKIEEFQEKYTDKIVNFPGISFYILFNENLLDE